MSIVTFSCFRLNSLLFFRWIISCNRFYSLNICSFTSFFEGLKLILSVGDWDIELIGVCVLNIWHLLREMEFLGSFIILWYVKIGICFSLLKRIIILSLLWHFKILWKHITILTNIFSFSFTPTGGTRWHTRIHGGSTRSGRSHQFTKRGSKGRNGARLTN